MKFWEGSFPITHVYNMYIQFINEAEGKKGKKIK